MKCLFCNQEMEDDEKLVDFHVCLPEQSILVNDVFSIMDEIVDSDEMDGWEAFIKLRERLAGKEADPACGQAKCECGKKVCKCKGSEYPVPGGQA